MAISNSRRWVGQAVPIAIVLGGLSVPAAGLVSEMRKARIAVQASVTI